MEFQKSDTRLLREVGTIEVNLYPTNEKYIFDEQNCYFVYGCH